jgi:3-hydroxyacyl-[acyl-carrier-protein] dehydratase
VNLTRHVRGIWKFSAVARVEDVVAAEAELMCTVRDLPA